MNTALLKIADEDMVIIDIKPRITLREHLQYHYNTLMTEYTEIDKRLKNNQNKKQDIDEKMNYNDHKYNTRTKEWIDSGYNYYRERVPAKDICNNWDYDWLIEKINDDTIKLSPLKNKLIILNKKLNNSEYLISLNRKELNERRDWFVDKIILGIGTNATGDSNSSLQGSIDGGMSGASFLGIGSISGYIDGEIDGHSNAKYEENILVKFKYNLDYKIDEILFNINDYLKEV